MLDKIELFVSEQDERVIQKLVVNLEHPGTLLADFQTLLEYVMVNEPELTASHLLPMKMLQPLNDALKRPLLHGLKRPSHKSFPNVAGLYLLLRASGLAVITASGRKHRLTINQFVLDSWQTLTPLEQYLTLLESWLARGSVDLLGEDGHWFRGGQHPLTGWKYLFAFIINNPPSDPKELTSNIKYTSGFYNLALLEFFGFVTVQYASPVPGEGLQVGAVKGTPLGWAMLDLFSDLLRKHDNLFDIISKPPESRPGDLKPYLQPYFPSWQNTLEWLPDIFQPGIYIFKVIVWGKIWRRIAIAADDMLESLAQAILRAYQFDDDHLYRFIYPNRLGLKQQVNHPFMEEGLFTTEFQIGDLSLPIGGVMIFHYDFGDNWEFEVVLEQIEPAPTGKRVKPKLLEKEGKSPPQYRGW